MSLKSYRWRADRTGPTHGLTSLKGECEAHSVEEVRREVAKELKDYAEQGLLQGDFSIAICSLKANGQVARFFAERTVFVHSLVYDREHNSWRAQG